MPDNKINIDITIPATHAVRIQGNYHYECRCGFTTKDKKEFNDHLIENLF